MKNAFGSKKERRRGYNMSEYRMNYPGQKRHEAFIQEIFIDMSQWEEEERNKAALVEIEDLFNNLFDEEESDEAMWF